MRKTFVKIYVKLVAIVFRYLKFGIIGKSGMEKKSFKEYEKEFSRELLPYAESSDNLIYSILLFSGNKYVDIENKKINFSDEFESLLGLAKKYDENKDVYESEYASTLVNSGKALFLDYDIYQPLDYFTYQKMFGHSLESYSDNKKPILEIMGTQLAICNNSNYKEGVYDFLNFIFDDDNYYRYSGYRNAIPVLKNFEIDNRKMYTTDAQYTDRFGNVVDPFDCDMSIDDYNVRVNKITEDDYAKFEEYCNSAEYIEPMPDKYMDIILEEAELYFEDKKSLDDTVKAIENRVTNALNE